MHDDMKALRLINTHRSPVVGTADYLVHIKIPERMEQWKRKLINKEENSNNIDNMSLTVSTNIVVIISIL